MALRNNLLSIVVLFTFTHTFIVGSSLEITRCMLFCDFQNGYILSPTGCRCVRIKSPVQPLCPHAMCEPNPCQVYKTDANGCLTCECQCPATVCPTTCSEGVEVFNDATGCPQCLCKSNCDHPNCDMVCPNGLVVDRFGCTLCACASEPLM